MAIHPLLKMQSLIKILLVVFVGGCMAIQIYFYVKSISFYKHYFQFIKPNRELFCHSLDTFEKLPEIQDNQVNRDRSIFFLETTCHSFDNGKLWINSRQACAVESAAYMNPNRSVYLLFASPGVLHNDKSEASRIIASLLSYSNIHLLYYDVNKFVAHTPVENLWISRNVLKSKYIVAHTSDILRLLVLWKYGGIYLDLDTVVIKNLDDLPSNFAGAQGRDDMANGVMGFSSVGIGHEHVTSCLNDLTAHFDGNTWGANGPALISKMVSRLCKGPVRDFINKTCEGFHVFPPSSFYPIYYPSWKLYFDTNKLDKVRRMTNESYLIHVWNKLSVDKKIYAYENGPYLDIARQFCPETVRNLDEFF